MINNARGGLTRRQYRLLKRLALVNEYFPGVDCQIDSRHIAEVRELAFRGFAVCPSDATALNGLWNITHYGKVFLATQALSGWMTGTAALVAAVAGWNKERQGAGVSAQGAVHRPYDRPKLCGWHGND
jgi:hypothetical protein